MRPTRTVLAIALLAAAMVGCAGGVTRRMASDAVLRGHIQEAIAADRTMAAEMEKLMASDSTRSVAVERAFANPDGAREIMLAVARDRERFDGVLALAVQDTAMRDHALTLFRGMEMAGTR